MKVTKKSGGGPGPVPAPKLPKAKPVRKRK